MDQPVLQRSKKVIITGGSGLTGRYLTSLLLNEGYSVSHLSRNNNQFGKVRVYRWDPEKKIIDPAIFEGIDYIIHLAGANIGEKPWTRERKNEILSSRIDSAKLIYNTLSDNGINIKAFISASATGYYGSATTDRILKEEDVSAEDFLGTTCRLWEEAADQFSKTGARVVKIRTGVVIEKRNGLVPKLLKPARFGIFPKLGAGSQFIPWIYIEDLCGIYLKALMDEKMEGAYNAVSPQQITQLDFMRTLAKVMKRPFFHPHLPAIILKMALGEMSDIVLTGSRVSAEKIINAGYRFDYAELDKVLNKILN